LGTKEKPTTSRNRDTKGNLSDKEEVGWKLGRRERSHQRKHAVDKYFGKHRGGGRGKVRRRQQEETHSKRKTERERGGSFPRWVRNREKFKKREKEQGEKWA